LRRSHRCKTREPPLWRNHNLPPRDEPRFGPRWYAVIEVLFPAKTFRWVSSTDVTPGDRSNVPQGGPNMSKTISSNRGAFILNNVGDNPLTILAGITVAGPGYGIYADGTQTLVHHQSRHRVSECCE
jgi:hypothetical protein